MFRLHRHKGSEKSGERIDFNFSHFNALQIPKGWEKLVVSMVSVETGKTVAKSSKALARNGKCQWTETLSESIWVAQDDASKELQESLRKLVVSMGSSRSGILGETIINLANYASSKASVPISVPLKKCNYGTTIQFKLQCLTPTTNIRNEKLQQKTSHLENTNEEYDDMDKKSDTSDSTYTRSIGSSSSNYLANTFQPGEPGSRNTSFSASGSRNSFDSAEGSMDRINFSPRNNLNLENVIGAQESFDSPRIGIYGNSVVDIARSSPLNSKFTGSRSNPNMSPLRGDASAKDLLEAAEDTIEDLRAEAKMWEGNARKVMADMEILRKELADQSRNHANLDLELSAVKIERDGLKREIEQLAILLEESKMKERSMENSNFQLEDASHIQKELEADMKFQKESNAVLTLQLQKTQESNLELVSILQELEETIEKQKLELSNLSDVKTKSSDEENEDTRILGANDRSILEQQLQELQESHKELQDTVKILEETIEDKNKEFELEEKLRKKSVFDIEAEWASRLSKKDEDISKLEAKLLLNAQSSHEMGSANGSNTDLTKEVEKLKEKVEELEKDCNELTEENLELLLKLKESKKGLQEGGISFSSSYNELQTGTAPSTPESEVQLLNSQIYQLEEEMKRKESHCDDLSSELIDLQNKCTTLETQLQSVQDRACHLDDLIHNSRSKSEAQVLEITKLKQQLQQCEEREAKEKERLETLELHSSREMREFSQELYKQLELALAQVKNPWSVSDNTNTESENNFDCNPNSADLITQTELAEDILNKAADLNKLLEAKIRECQVELQHNEVKKRVEFSNEVEKIEEFSLRDTDLYLPAEEINKPQIEDIRNDLLAKEHENEALRHFQIELEAQISNLERDKIQLQENLEILSRESSITSKCLDKVRDDMMVLSSSLDSHVSANKMLEKNVSELESGKGKLELHLSELEEKCMHLEAELRDSRRGFSDCCKKVEILEAAFCSVQQDIASKENFFSSELDALAHENNENREKLVLEKEVEVENLQREVRHLQDEVSFLKSSLYEMNFEKTKVEALLQSFSEDVDKLKAERDLYIEKISSLQNSVSELEDCKSSKIALEEKLLRLEGDQTAKGLLCDQDTKLRNELNMIKIENRKMQQTVQCLEKEKEECSKRALALEEELKLQKDEANIEVNAPHENLPVVDNRHNDQNRTPQGGADILPKLLLLETELAEALETNEMYKTQLKKLLIDSQNGHVNAPKRSMSEGVAVRKTASLEAELKDLRERYFHMSLKFAEVEAEREKLVMKLKSLNNGKRWFS